MGETVEHAMSLTGDQPETQTVAEVTHIGAPKVGYVARFRVVINTRTFIWSLVLVSGGVFLWRAAATADFVKSMIGVAAVFAAWMLVAGLLAVRHSRAEVLREYARQRNLRFVGDIVLPGSTPLLAAGESQRVEQYIDGPLSAELPGVTFGLAHHTFEEYEVTHSRRGNTVEVRVPHPTTVCVVALPECADAVRGLYVTRRRGVMKSISGTVWLDYKSLHRLTFESDEFSHRYDVYAAAAEDEEAVNRLLKPSIQHWLANLPTELYFEYHQGTLVVYRFKHESTAAELDALIHATAHIARSLHDLAAA